MTEYTGTGDPARSMELLWGTRPPSGRGPRPALTVPRIVEAAVALADAEGLAALSMRRVAERLGAGAMSLYRYVPGKGELVDVMLDTVLGAMPREPWPAAATWRQRLERVARDNLELALRHPWTLQVAATSRPPLGPGVMAKYDHELGALAGSGLSAVDTDAALTLVLQYVQGAARNAVEAAQAEGRTGMTDRDWWEAHAPLLEKVYDPERYPTATVIGAEVGESLQAAFDPTAAFEFGLARVLDGLELYVRGQRAPTE